MDSGRPRIVLDLPSGLAILACNASGILMVADFPEPVLNSASEMSEHVVFITFLGT